MLALLLALLACPLTVTVSTDTQTIGGHSFDLANIYVTNPTRVPYAVDLFRVGGQERNPVLEDGASVSDLTVAPGDKHYFGFDIDKSTWDPNATPSVMCHALDPKPD